MVYRAIYGSLLLVAAVALSQQAEPDPKPVEIEAHPYIAAIVEIPTEDENGPLRCSGTILDPEWILTSAGCFTEEAEESATAYKMIPWTNFQVLVGAVNIHPERGESTDPYSQSLEIANVILAEDYKLDKKGEYWHGDVALVKLNGSITFGPNGTAPNRVWMPTPEALEKRVFNGLRVSAFDILGWRINGAFSKPHAKLQRFTAERLAGEDCDGLHDDEETLFCMETPEKDTVCSSDIGAPTVFHTLQPTWAWIQIGMLVEAPDNCRGDNEEEGSQMRFIDTSEYCEWMAKMTEKEICTDTPPYLEELK
ncbi:unnamed protein product, partial [Mesorhabditis spiculigera]